MSTEVDAIKIPLKPPITNMETKATAFNIEGVKRKVPRHIVPSQLKTFTPEGTAISIVESIKVVPTVGFIPLWNM